MIVPTLRVTLLQGFGLALPGGCGWGFGFFLQDFGLCMNLSRAVSAPSLRPVIAKNGDTDVQVRLHVGAPTPIAIQRAFFMPAVFVMAAVRGRSFGVCRGPICPVLHTCAQLPP
jgi:hypothetical protein